ncbi:hypothetical protein PybrP1_012486 [[Pythium] brassicae (nom. inval.)]|nr:hypothetical protein PybrP1_012486 [[Pythium] brassicae (nom. inval.)]
MTSSPPPPSSSSFAAAASSAPSPLCDARAMQQQLALFVRDGVRQSAQLLGELLVALAAADAPVEGDARAFHARSFFLFAELLAAQREFKRAIQYYKRYWKLVAGPGGAAATHEAVEVKARIAQCWIELETLNPAFELLNSIPSQLRTLRVNLMLGKLFLHEGLKSKAEESFSAALRQNPYALEATLALTELAAAKETSLAAFGSSSSSSSSAGAATDPGDVVTRPRAIETFYATLPPSSSSSSPSSSSVAPADAAWLQTLVTAHLSARRGRYRAAVAAFEALERVFPDNLHCLLHRGKLELEQEFFHQAHVLFHRARQVDAQNLAMMDLHADCLRRNRARTQLGSLVHELFETSDRHAEVWLAAAYYSDMKGEHEAALQLCERAVAANRRHAPAHLFRGSLLLTLRRPEPALAAFTASCKLAKTLDAYAGMVLSYCGLCASGANRYKEAVNTAKSVVKLFPQKAQSFALLGNVFALRPENKEHARKAFQRALALEPRKLTAVFGLVDLLLHEGNFSAAIDKLLVTSEQFAREEVFTKLGDVYTLDKQFSEAMTQYHRSLSLNPASADALRGLDRLEKLMRGEDPDELSTTMDHMDPDEHDESMEASEYMNA